jgi:hypothetical protein
MNRRTFLAGLPAAALAAGDPLAETVQIGTLDFPVHKLPRPVVLREPIGLVCAPAVDGRIVHRSRRETLFECRATITPKGDYLLLFPEGKHHAGHNTDKVNDMVAYRSSDRGKTWQGPTIAFGEEMNHHGFIPLVPQGSSRIYAFGTQPIFGTMQDRENFPVGFRYSDDDGRTWTAPTLIRPLNDPGYQGMSVMRMCETDRGTWLLGTHEGDWKIKPLRTRLYVLRSTDKGATWTLLPDKRPNGWFAKSFDRMDEGRPVSLGRGEVFLMMRTPQGHLWSTRSTDDGLTWAMPQATPLVHPDAPPMLFLLSDGKTLAAFHHNRYSLKKYEGLNTSPQVMRDRSEIWVATSKDGGRSWTEPRFVFANALAPNLANAFFNHQCSYLDAIVDRGALHLFVPHRWERVLHLQLRERDLARLPRASDLGL